jgi:hypothetical protein
MELDVLYVTITERGHEVREILDVACVVSDDIGVRICYDGGKEDEFIPYPTNPYTDMKVIAVPSHG